MVFLLAMLVDEAVMDAIIILPASYIDFNSLNKMNIYSIIVLKNKIDIISKTRMNKMNYKQLKSWLKIQDGRILQLFQFSPNNDTILILFVNQF
jgi:translation initiation factor 2 gamma subunit (eIF-2gamma)